MANVNGYLSDCGAPSGQTYNYHFANSNNNDDNNDDASHHQPSSSSSSSNHLSFLYDRAQGHSYTATPPHHQQLQQQQLSPAAAGSENSSCADRLLNSSTGSFTNCESLKNKNSFEATPPADGRGSLCRATPAPAYPYSPPPSTGALAAAAPPSAPRSPESMACQSGTYSGAHQDPNGTHMTTAPPPPPTSNRHQQPQGADQPFSRQVSQLNISMQKNNSNNGSTSTVEQGQGPRSNEGQQQQQQPAAGNRGQQRWNRGQGRETPGDHFFKSPAATNQGDPRRNHIRQNIPWRDINSARKFSVPINLNRSRIQMTEFSLDDDQLRNRRQPEDPRSPPPPHPHPTPEVDRSSVRQLLREGDEIGNYEQASIRYTGKTNPSKFFRLLQSATGSSDSESIERHNQERRDRRRQRTEELSSSSAAEDRDREKAKDADDVVDISYVGSKIPSRTFRSLQEAIGARDQQAGVSASPSVYSFNGYAGSPFEEQPIRTVKVVHLRPQKSLENLIGDF